MALTPQFIWKWNSNERIILKWAFKKEGGVALTGFICLSVGTDGRLLYMLQ